VTPGFTDTTDRNGRDARIQALAQVPVAALARLPRAPERRSGLPWYRDGHRPAPAPGLDELQAVFYSSKRHTIDQRGVELVIRDDEHDGAPPHAGVDLTGRRAVITLVPARRAN
jgi:Family of unknown function (DUF6191)